MNILDTLTPAQQTDMITRFEGLDTLKEIIYWLEDDTGLIVSEMTIRRWLKKKKVTRTYYTVDRQNLKIRQWTSIKEKKAFATQIIRGRLNTMIRTNAITPDDLIDLITGVDVDKVQIAWNKSDSVRA